MESNSDAYKYSKNNTKILSIIEVKEHLIVVQMHRIVKVQKVGEGKFECHEIYNIKNDVVTEKVIKDAKFSKSHGSLYLLLAETSASASIVCKLDFDEHCSSNSAVTVNYINAQVYHLELDSRNPMNVFLVCRDRVYSFRFRKNERDKSVQIVRKIKKLFSVIKQIRHAASSGDDVAEEGPESPVRNWVQNEFIRKHAKIQWILWNLQNRGYRQKKDFKGVINDMHSKSRTQPEDLNPWNGKSHELSLEKVGFVLNMLDYELFNHVDQILRSEMLETEKVVLMRDLLILLESYNFGIFSIKSMVDFLGVARVVNSDKIKTLKNMLKMIKLYQIYNFLFPPEEDFDVYPIQNKLFLVENFKDFERYLVKNDNRRLVERIKRMDPGQAEACKKLAKELKVNLRIELFIKKIEFEVYFKWDQDEPKRFKRVSKIVAQQHHHPKRESIIGGRGQGPRGEGPGMSAHGNLSKNELIINIGNKLNFIEANQYDEIQEILEGSEPDDAKVDSILAIDQLEENFPFFFKIVRETDFESDKSKIKTIKMILEDRRIKSFKSITKFLDKINKTDRKSTLAEHMQDSAKQRDKDLVEIHSNNEYSIRFLKFDASMTHFYTHRSNLVERYVYDSSKRVAKFAMKSNPRDMWIRPGETHMIW